MVLVLGMFLDLISWPFFGYVFWAVFWAAWLGCAGLRLAGAGLVEAGTGVAGANMGLGLAWE